MSPWELTFGQYLGAVAEYHREHLELTRQQRKNDLQKTLKIEHKLTKVGHSGEGQIPFDLMKLERQLQEHRVDTWAEWVQYLMCAVIDKLKKFIEARQTRDPARSLISRARGPLGTAQDWKMVYLQCRWEILIWCKADLFKPSDEAEKYWKSHSVSKNQCEDAKALYDKLQDLEEARGYMVLTGAFEYDANGIMDKRSLEKEMKGLEEKIPKGTTLYRFIYTGVWPQDFDQWCNKIREFARTCPQETPLMIKTNVAKVVNASAREGAGSGPQVEVRRFGNDARLSATGGGGEARKQASGGGPGRNSQQGQASAEALKHVPKCATCGGRHHPGPPERCKPNEYAKARGYRQSGNRTCDYLTKPWDVSCRGMGHERRDHIRFMQELAVRRQAAKRFAPHSKGKGRGKGKSKGKSKGKGKGKRYIPRPSGPNKIVYTTNKFRKTKYVRAKQFDVKTGEELPAQEEEVQEEVFVELPFPDDAPEAEGVIDEIDEYLEWDNPEGEVAEEVEEQPPDEEEVVEEEQDGGEQEDQDGDDYEGEYVEVQGSRAVVVTGDWDDFPDDEVWEESLPMTWGEDEVPLRSGRLRKY